jgi:biotin carboxylase
MSQADLKGKVIIIVGAGGASKRPILERIQELGVKIVMVDTPNKRNSFEYLDFIPVDILNLEQMATQAVQGIREAGHVRASLLKTDKPQQKGWKADGILTYWEDFVGVGAEIGTALGLITNSAESANIARSKNLTRVAMKKAGLPTPVSILCKKVEDLEEAVKVCPFPAVVKPVFGAKAQGALKVMDAEHARAAFAYNQATLTPELDEIYAQGADCLLEQYLDGQEVDVDLLLQDGELKYWSITDNLPTLEPSFVHTGANLPSVLPEQKQREMVNLAVRTCQAMGMNNGCLHVEMKYTTNSGPQIVEVNGRMAGSPYPDWIQNVWGVDLVRESLFIAFRISINPRKAAQPLCAMALSWILSSSPSTLTQSEIATFKRLESLSTPVEIKVIFDVPEGYSYHQVGEEAIGYIQTKGSNLLDCIKQYETIRSKPFPEYLWPAGAELLATMTTNDAVERVRRMDSVHEQQQRRFSEDLERVRSASFSSMSRSRRDSISKLLGSSPMLSTSPAVLESMEVYFQNRHN